MTSWKIATLRLRSLRKDSGQAILAMTRQRQLAAVVALFRNEVSYDADSNQSPPDVGKIGEAKVLD